MVGPSPGRGDRSAREGTEEGARIERVYDAYRQDPRKQRAWSRENAGNAAIRAELLELVVRELRDLTSTGDLLDAGCGGGWWLEALADRGVPQDRLHGIDLLRSRVAAAEAAVPSADIRVGDVRALPFPSGRFRAVLLLTVLSSLSDLASARGALAEARRVTASGGLILCYEPRYPNPLNRSTLHISRRLLRESLGPDCRFVSVTVLPGLARRLGRATPDLYPRLCRLSPLRSHRLTVCEVGARGNRPPANIKKL